jgi:hypothetical protein
MVIPDFFSRGSRKTAWMPAKTIKVHGFTLKGAMARQARKVYGFPPGDRGNDIFLAHGNDIFFLFGVTEVAG